jgi:Kef-type K+ transport system membrane component KefB
MNAAADGMAAFGDALTAYVFYEVAALLALAAAGGFLGLMLRQPLIVSFIAVGVLVGPSALNIAQAEAHITLLSSLGIALLLFLVGLKLDVAMVRTLGPVALVTGLGQVAFTSAIGFALALGLGFAPMASLFIAVALTFSSTIIIVKLLSDKRELASLHGRIALGFLIVQDIVVVLAMIVLAAFGAGAGEGAGGDAALADIARVAGAGAGMLVGVALFIRFVADPLTTRLSRAPELLVCFAIGWAAALAALGHWLGFGKELGGLLAGVSLASTPFREAIAARLSALRDFLLLFFFIGLGASLDLTALQAGAGAAALLSAFVLIGNPLIVMTLMGVMGYRSRTGFLAGLTVAQISEFSLVFMAMGVALGHVGADALALVTLVGLITIAASTYMITWSHEIYALLSPLLGVFQRRDAGRREDAWRPLGDGYDAIVFGLGRYGSGVAASLRASGWRVLGVDFDPLAVRTGRAAGLDVVFGDASDPEFLAHLPLGDAAWAVATLPELGGGVTHDDVRRTLLRGLRAAGFHGRLAAAAHAPEAEIALRADGVDTVLRPFADAASAAATQLTQAPASKVRSPARRRATG